MRTPVDVDASHRPVLVVTINRPERKNSVDRETAFALHDAFVNFDKNDAFSVAILQGAGGAFCAGADLKAMLDSSGRRAEERGNPLNEDMTKIAPMGCTRLQLRKPVIACISGPAVAGGLELAAWCDLRVADDTARFGVFCRMRGVPLIDGGTIRLPRLIGLSAASDMILTGREVGATEGKALSLVNYLVESHGAPGESALSKALEVARLIASHPQACLRNDRGSMLENAYNKSELDLMQREFDYGLRTLRGPDFGTQVQAFVNRSRL